MGNQLAELLLVGGLLAAVVVVIRNYAVTKSGYYGGTYYIAGDVLGAPERGYGVASGPNAGP